LFCLLLFRFHPDPILSRFHPNLVPILSQFRPDFISISSRFCPDFVPISSSFHPDFIPISSLFHWILCLAFWQSYFIKLFDAGLQCKCIQAFFNTYSMLTSDIESFFRVFIWHVVLCTELYVGQTASYTRFNENPFLGITRGIYFLRDFGVERKSEKERKHRFHISIQMFLSSLDSSSTHVGSFRPNSPTT